VKQNIKNKVKCIYKFSGNRVLSQKIKQSAQPVNSNALELNYLQGR
jgi:hypothetical protein